MDAQSLDSYVANMYYLEQAWTEKEVRAFAFLVEKKIKLLRSQPQIGVPRSKKRPDIRHTVLHKRVSLIYRIHRQLYLLQI